MTLDPGTTEATVAEPDAWQVKGKQLIRIAALTAEIAALANDADKDAEDPDTQRVNDRANKAMAEALAHLRSHPAAADAQRWIPVSERLPEIGTDCLVWHAGFNNIGPFAKIDRWDEQRECPVSFSTVTVPIGPGWDDSDFDDVLYWMLLPPPPAAMGAAPAQLAWTDNEGVHHSMSRESAAATLQQLFQEWPGGLEEIEASVTSWRNRAQESGWRHMAADYLAGLHAKQENSPTAHNYYACAARDLRESAAMGAAPSADSGQPQQPEKDHLAAGGEDLEGRLTPHQLWREKAIWLLDALTDATRELRDSGELSAMLAHFDAHPSLAAPSPDAAPVAKPDPNEDFCGACFDDRLSRADLRKMIGRMNFALTHWKNLAESRRRKVDVGQEPTIFVSEQQLPTIRLGKSLYLPYRLKSEGNFQMPLYAHPAPSTDALRQSHRELMDAATVFLTLNSACAGADKLAAALTRAKEVQP
jgi:hypothetical protein